jgi:hypothetical protein
MQNRERLALQDILLDIADDCDADSASALKAKAYSTRYLAGLGLPPERIHALLTGKTPA